MAAHFDMAAASLITGMTNVVSIRCDDLTCKYNGLGDAAMSEFDIHHRGHRRKQEEINNWFTRINTFQVEQIAKLVAKLKSVPEGNGTMMDNTLIIYNCDIGHQIHSNFDNMPMVLIGNLNNKFETGQYIVYPSYNEDGHQNLQNLYLSFFDSIGKPRKQFNSIDHAMKKSINQNSPLESIMT